MKKPIFTGAAVAIVTPFLPKDGGVNFEKLGELIDEQIARKTDAIVICGTTGESPVLDDEEHRKCIEFAVKHTAGRVPVIAGTGSNDTAYGLHLTKHAEEAGVDGVLMVTPYYNKTTQKGLIEHYLYIADRTNVPTIVYNVPGRTGMTIQPETYYAMSKHPNINGIKEACGNLSTVVQTRKLCGDDMYIWSGEDIQTLPILSVGGKGVISTSSNIIPEVMHDICAKFFEGDIAAAEALQIEWSDLMDAMFIETNPIPVKTAMELMGYEVGGLRLPLTTMTEGNLAKVKVSLTAHGLLK